MRFQQYDPYESFFASDRKAFRNSAGDRIPEEASNDDLLEIGVELAGLLGPLTRTDWEGYKKQVDQLFREMRDTLDEAGRLKKVTFLSPEGEEIDPQWVSRDEAAVALAWVGVARSFPDTQRSDLVQAFGVALCFAAFRQIDYALLGLQFNDVDALQMTLDGGFTAAKLLRTLIELAPRDAVAANVDHAQSRFEKDPHVVLKAIRSGARLGGLRSAETRRKSAVDSAKVIAAARDLGWPAAKEGINKRLALRFDCSPERIGQILRTTK